MRYTYSHSWTLPTSPASVFRALTDTRSLTKWFSSGAQVEARAGGVYRFWGRHTLGTPSEDSARQTITRFEPEKLLAYEWPINEVDTDVLIRLAAAPQGTTLSLRHGVWGDIGFPRQEELVGDFWQTAIGNLAAHLEGRDIAMPDYFAHPTRNE